MTTDPVNRRQTAFGQRPERRHLRKAVFLDRDGVLIRDAHYLSEVAGIEILPGVIEALRRLAPHYRLILATNQSGVARGLFSIERLHQIHDALLDQLAQHGVALDAVYFCPHHVAGSVAPYAIDCSCRKPMPGMLAHGLRMWDLCAADSVMIGDQDSDILAGRNAGVTAIRIGPPSTACAHGAASFSDLEQATSYLLAGAI